MPTQDFYATGLAITFYRFLFYFGAIGFVGIFYLAIIVDPGLAGISSAFLLMTLISGINNYCYGKHPVASFKPSHVEIKLAPLASAKFIKYTDITAIHETNNNKIIIKSTTEKKLSIALSFFSDEDKQNVMAAFNAISTH